MQDIKTIRATQTAPAIILNSNLEHELLIRETRAKYLAKDKEELAIFNQGEIALDNAAYNGNESDVIHTNGHIIQTNRARNNRFNTAQHEKDENGLKALARILAETGITMAVLNAWMQGIAATVAPPRSSSALKGTFDDKAQDTMQIVMDENFIYGGENVTERTAELFNKRIQRILDYQKLIDETSDPAKKAILEDKFERLVDRSNAIFHPDIGWSIAAERVSRVDDHLVELHGECNDGVVCTFSPRSYGSHNSRKMKIDVADQFDDNPTETVGEVKAEVTQRVAPPEYKFVR